MVNYLFYHLLTESYVSGLVVVVVSVFLLLNCCYKLLSLVQVAACELLHTLVIYMVGKSAQMAEGENTLPPMYKLHKKLFPVLLRLACDVDQVCSLCFKLRAV